jgi:hypothetical protein
VVKVFVEGGGDSNQLRTNCRKGFSAFLEKAGLKGKMPRIVACGSRQHAYDDFCTALNNGENALLLVDSECAVSAKYKEDDDKLESWQPWQHLANRQSDQWETPKNATNSQCHLMVQCMESWFLADRDTLQDFFGQGFNANQLPSANPIEAIDKQQIYDGLAKATKDCKSKASYGKGEHSFKILEKIDPQKVIDASPWAKRFVAVLKTTMGVV